MRRVSAAHPCPVCKKPDWCLIAPDGSAAICHRIESGKKCGEAGWLHRLNGSAPNSSPKQPTDTGTDWRARAAKFAANLDANRRAQLAAWLKLPAEALDSLPLLGFNPDDKAGECYTFAEMDATGKVVGLLRRFRDGTKKTTFGSKRGLSQPTGWRERPGPVFAVEGPTDTAAAAAAGLAAIGRPSNSGGVAFLAELFRDLDADLEIVIVGENDRKDGNEWPGRTGAVSVATGLAKALRRSVGWVLPPEPAKDVRDWLTDPARTETPWNARGDELRAHLIANATTVEPPDETPGVTGTPEGPNDGPTNPHRLATGYLESLPPCDPPPVPNAGECWRPALRFWRGEFHRYCAGAYRAVPDDDIRGEVTEYVRGEFVRLNAEELAAWRISDGKNKGGPPLVRPVTSRLVGDVLQALRGLCLLPAAVDAPAWIDGTTGPNPADLLPFTNGILDFGALAAHRAGCLLPPSLSYFTPTAAPFDFDPTAPEPSEWLKFLREVWPDDQESIDTLQEWFGYLLTPDTRQQKILFLLGPRRGGKGTIARILCELVGPANVAGPTLGSLATPFGLSPLLGKSVALISDARLSGRSDSAVITERLLSISGEDTLSIDRKFREALTVKLNTRFVILSNELPRLGDASGALAGRLILLRLTRSWYGKEDAKLFDRLKTELPGILLWAVEGWRRLHARGRFIQPGSAAELVSEMEDLSSPVGAFVRDCCWVSPGERVAVSELYAAWRSWCEEHGRKEPGIEEAFGRDLRAVVPKLGKSRPRTPEGRLPLYTGIRLRLPTDPEPDGQTSRGHSGHGGHSDPTSHAQPKRNEVEMPANAERRAMPGHGDHRDRPRIRFSNDDRPHEARRTGD